MRKCIYCGVEKNYEEFYKKGKYYSSRCKDCFKLYTCPKEKAEYDRARRIKHGDKLREYDRKRSQLPHRKASKRDWSRKRKMTVANQTPVWANQDYIKRLYKDAVTISRITGVDYEVDHIIPLHGENVSGLHVQGNLRIITAEENRKKRNEF